MINPELLKKLRSLKEPECISLKRKEIMDIPGGISENIIFINAGLVRSFLTTSDGNEVNKTFVFDGMFHSDLYSYWRKYDSGQKIEVLEDSNIMVFKTSSLDEIMQNDNELMSLFLEYLKERHIRHERRVISLQIHSAKERYMQFISDYPHANARIPAYHIASYLGITDVSLSRIKKSLEM